MFTYCGNNPVVYEDQCGTEYTPVGGGIQIEFNCGGYTVGVEIIVYWDVDECEGKGPQIAVYVYGGAGISTDDPFLAAMLTAIMENINFLTSGYEDDIVMLAAMLSRDFSVSVSGLLIFGDETFTTTESYEGYFTSVSLSGGSVKGGYAYSDNSFAVSLGRNVKGFSLFPTINVSRTAYEQLFEFNLMDLMFVDRICMLAEGV